MFYGPDATPQPAKAHVTGLPRSGERRALAILTAGGGLRLGGVGGAPTRLASLDIRHMQGSYRWSNVDVGLKRGDLNEDEKHEVD
jgi:hypothetical protein